MPRYHRPIATAAAACALALALLAHPATAVGISAMIAQQSTDEQAVSVDVRQPTSALSPDGTFRADVSVSLTLPAKYVEVRLRLLSPAGHLIYQKTEVRSELSAGRHAVSYEYDLAELALAPGRYPIEVRVLATGADPTTVADRVLILPAEYEPLPVALVVRVSARPAVASDGRFTQDPATETGLRDSIASVTQLSLARRAPIALAVAPVLVEQLARAADGYETTDGIVVQPTDEAARRYATTVADLRSAIASGALELVDLPYALPDSMGLDLAGARDDLSAHWERGDSVMAGVLGVQEHAAVTFVGDYPTVAATDALAIREPVPALVTPEALRTEDGTVTPGVYEVRGSAVPLVAVDAEAARAATLGPAEFYDALYERLGVADATIIMLELGPDGPNAIADVQRVLDWVAGAPWLDAAYLEEAVAGTPGTASLALRPKSGAPDGYWDSVAEARAAALAYTAATGDEDPEADAMLRAVLTAESSLWADAEGRWVGAQSGLDLADAVAEFVASEFALVTIQARDVTLAGSRGGVPLELTNDTGKRLTLTLSSTSDYIGLPQPELPITAEPADTFITVPVNLGRILSGDLYVSVMAGPREIARTEVRVKASHLDRLATVGMVVLVMIALLFFIRRRVNAAIAGTISVDED